jgi:hypothetical protein
MNALGYSHTRAAVEDPLDSGAARPFVARSASPEGILQYPIILRGKMF